ncbi:hypothetical protein PQX77_012942 [Marasmius sp. AFHP31]|nr:hypothetical protein PQX77_012942 [Marasmius sp. AFHP31]
MAAASVVSDSEREETPAQGRNKRGKDKDEVEEIEDEEEGEDDEEYEIEAILNHKKGKFESGKMAYFVKWKGYDNPKDNTWVRESDAENAKELIDEYWEKKSRKENGSVARKGRRSTAAETPEPSISTKKRARRPLSEDEKPSASKRQKQRDDGTENSEPEDVEMDDGTVKIRDAKFMHKFNHLESWEDIIREIDTVEHTPMDGSNLTVYIRLMKKEGGDRVKLPSATCNKKFPQKMIKFYEGNLKWKETEMDDDA